MPTFIQGRHRPWRPCFPAAASIQMERRERQLALASATFLQHARLLCSMITTNGRSMTHVVAVRRWSAAQCFAGRVRAAHCAKKRRYSDSPTCSESAFGVFRVWGQDPYALFAKLQLWHSTWRPGGNLFCFNQR